MAKEAFSRKISLLTIKLNIELRRNSLDVMFGALLCYGSEAWTLRGVEIFGEL